MYLGLFSGDRPEQAVDQLVSDDSVKPSVYSGV